MKITNKQFREYLNKAFPIKENVKVGGERPGGFGNIKRKYGDYLWFQDRDIFNDMLRRVEEGEILEIAEFQFINKEKELLSLFKQLGDTLNTKEIGKKLGISTKEAYKLCCCCNQLVRYGYKVKDGWEDPEYSKRKPCSLYWQRVLEE